MKKILLAAIAVIVAASLHAQPQQGDRHSREQKMKIEEIITDLTPQQKSRIDAITKSSTKKIEHYRSQLKAVRDSIRLFMDIREDHSDKVMPLYDREGALQAELSKEYYRSKVAIDAVLTTDQYNRMREQMAEKRSKSVPANRKHNKSKPSGK